MSGELTLGRWIRDRARTTPGRVAIDFLGAETSYAELDERSERLAAGLLEAGLVRGDRVATLTGTSPEHVVAFFACAKAGLVLLPLLIYHLLQLVVSAPFASRLARSPRPLPDGAG